MRDILWRIGFTFAALSILAVLGGSASCSVDGRIIEQITGEKPQARIDQYLAAIAKGARKEALALWSLEGMSGATLEARREAVTDDLLAFGTHLEHRILDVEWWRTCCEPGVIDDPDEAGGARIRVAISSKDRREEVYIFDLLVPGGYWGAATGHPARQWVIRDLYPEGATPLIWNRR